jgi:hypothetical protein
MTAIKFMATQNARGHVVCMHFASKSGDLLKTAEPASLRAIADKAALLISAT